MEECFLSEKHKQNFFAMMGELGFKDIKDIDSYWRSLIFIISGNEQLFAVRRSLIDAEQKLIKLNWFTSGYSSGEEKLLALAYNLFTNRDYFEFDDRTILYISPLDIFSSLDDYNYQLAKNAIDVRLKF